MNILTTRQIDYSFLFKLRLVVARIGEMDNARWWNTNKLLGSTGSTALKRGFPTTYHFAQARAVFAVASARVQEVFSVPPETVTLWKLPADIEDEFESNFQGWLDDYEVWSSFFEDIKSLSGVNLLDALKQHQLLDDATISTINSLNHTAGVRSIFLSGDHLLDNQLLMWLAGAYSLSDPGVPVVPYAKVVG